MLVRFLREENKHSPVGLKKAFPYSGTVRLQEVGFLALYLARSASGHITGQTLYLDKDRNLTPGCHRGEL